MRFRSANVISILECLCHGIDSFSEIKKKVSLEDASIAHFLKKLIKHDIVEKLGKGRYILKMRTPICYLFDDVDSFYYIGLLGMKNSHMEPEPESAVSLLENEGIKISRRIIFTTPEALYSWRGFDFSDYDIKIISAKDLLDIPVIEEKIHEAILPEMKSGLLILDCTSLTKTATIAMYNLAIKLNIPLIYVYEERRKLVWLISLDDVRKEVKKRLLS